GPIGRRRDRDGRDTGDRITPWLDGRTEGESAERRDDDAQDQTRQPDRPAEPPAPEPVRDVAAPSARNSAYDVFGAFRVDGHVRSRWSRLTHGAHRPELSVRYGAPPSAGARDGRLRSPSSRAGAPPGGQDRLFPFETGR